MKFVKMHGCGNDYVYLDGVTDRAVEARVGAPGWADLVKRMSDRHKGIGSDGVIVLCPPTGAAKADGAHVRMRMFNADGSESEMCGNGVRCVAKYAHDRLGVKADPMRVETGRGVLSIAYRTESGRVVEATVDMGEPILGLAEIPVDAGHIRPTGSKHEHEIRAGDASLRVVFVSMGNPHAVAFQPPLSESARSLLDDVGRWAVTRGAGRSEIEHLGGLVEVHPAFPNRVNMHFVRCIDRARANVITWERGAGITQACGTGACAVHVAGVLTDRLDREATLRVLGGELNIRWDRKSNHVFMTGPAEEVCEGVWLGG